MDMPFRPESQCLFVLDGFDDAFRLTCVNPAASNLRFTWRYGSGLSGTDLHLYGAHLRRGGRSGRLEVQLYGFAQILQGLFFALATR